MVIQIQQKKFEYEGAIGIVDGKIKAILWIPNITNVQQVCWVGIIRVV
jgi:hypothetical protein